MSGTAPGPTSTNGINRDATILPEHQTTVIEKNSISFSMHSDTEGFNPRAIDLNCNKGAADEQPFPNSLSGIFEDMPTIENATQSRPMLNVTKRRARRPRRSTILDSATDIYSSGLPKPVLESGATPVSMPPLSLHGASPLTGHSTSEYIEDNKMSEKSVDPRDDGDASLSLLTPVAADPSPKSRASEIATPNVERIPELENRARSDNNGALSSQAVNDIATEKPKVGKLDTSTIMKKLKSGAAQEDKTLMTPERTSVLHLRNNKHVTSRVGIGKTGIEFTPEEREKVEAERAEKAAESAIRFADKKAALDKESAAAEERSRLEANVHAKQHSEAEREMGEDKKKRAEIHAQKVAAAKKKARDAEAAETAHQQNLKQRATLSREMRLMNLEDKVRRFGKESDRKKVESVPDVERGSEAVKQNVNTEQVSIVMTQVFEMQDDTKNKLQPDIASSVPDEGPLKQDTEVETPSSFVEFPSPPAEIQVASESEISFSPKSGPKQTIIRRTPEEIAALLGGLEKKEFRLRLWKEFRGAIGAKHIGEGVVATSVFRDVMNRQEMYSLSPEQLSALEESAPHDKDGKILLQQWCDMAYDQLVKVLLDETEGDENGEVADEEEQKDPRVPLKRSSYAAKNFYREAQARAFNTKDMSRAALGLPAVKGTSEAAMRSKNIQIMLPPSTDDPLVGNETREPIAKLRILGSVLERAGIEKSETIADAISAVIKGDVAVLTRCIELDGINVNATNKGGQSLLDLAIQRNQPAIRKFLESRGAKKSCDLGNIAQISNRVTTSGRQNGPIPASSTTNQGKGHALPCVPYLIAWLHDASCARWASNLQRQFDELFPECAGTTTLDNPEPNSMIAAASIVILISRDFLSTKFFQETVLSAIQQHVPIVLLWRATNRVWDVADFRSLLTQNGRQMHSTILDVLRSAYLFKCNDHDSSASLTRLVRHLKEYHCVHFRFGEMRGLLGPTFKVGENFTTSTPGVEQFFKPLKVSKEIFEAISTNNIKLLQNLVVRASPSDPLLRAFDITRELSRALNMLQFAQGRKRQEMIDYLQGKVLRLQNETALQSTTTPGILCQAIVNDEPKIVRRILRDNRATMEDNTELIGKIAKTAGAHQIDSMISAMTFELKLSKYLALIANANGRDFVQLFCNFDQNGDGLVTSIELAEAVRIDLERTTNSSILGMLPSKNGVRNAIENIFGAAVNIPPKDIEIDLISFWSTVPGYIVSTSVLHDARNKSQLYFNPIATQRHKVERQLLNAVLKDDADAIEKMFLFEDADDQMKSPVGQSMVDFAKERGKNKAFRALMLWNRVYAHCSRIREEFRKQLDSHFGQLDTKRLMRTLDRTGDGFVEQAEFILCARESLDIRTIHDACLVFRMIVASSTSRCGWQRMNTNQTKLMERYPPITSTVDEEELSSAASTNTQQFRAITDYELRAFMVNDRDRMTGQIIIRPACPYLVMYVYNEDCDGAVLVSRQRSSGILDMKELSDGIFTVKIFIDLCSALDPISESSLLSLGELVVSKENGTLNVKSAVENNTAYFDAYGLSVRITKRAADAIAQTNLILQGKFVREATPNEISAGISYKPVRVALSTISGDNTIKLLLPKGRLILESIRGGKVDDHKEKPNQPFNGRIRALFSVGVPPIKEQSNDGGSNDDFDSQSSDTGYNGAFEDDSCEEEEEEEEEEETHVRAGPAQRRSDRFKVNSKEFSSKKKVSVTDDTNAGEFPSVLQDDEPVFSISRRTALALDPGRGRCHAITRRALVRLKLRKVMRIATKIFKAAKVLNSTAAIADSRASRSSGTAAFVLEKKWGLFEFEICTTNSMADLGTGTSAVRGLDLLSDQLNGLAEKYKIPIPLHSHRVQSSSITTVSTHPAINGLQVRSLLSAPHDRYDLEEPFRLRMGMRVKRCRLKNANTAALVRAHIQRQQQSQKIPDGRHALGNSHSEKISNIERLELESAGVQVKVGHVVHTTDTMRHEALGVSMSLAVEAAVNVKSNSEIVGGSEVSLLLSIIPDPIRIPNIYNYGPKNLRFHLDGAIIGETAVEFLPEPHDLLAEAYEFVDALTGEAVNDAVCRIIVNEKESVLKSNDSHIIDVPLEDIPEGEAKCRIATPEYINRHYTRIRYRSVPGNVPIAVRTFFMLPSRVIIPRLLTECGNDKTSVFGAALHLVLHSSMSDAQLDIHVKSSDDEHVYYGNSSSKDGDISVVPPTKQEGASVLSLLPRTGVSYIVWAYVYSFHDIFNIGAQAEIYVTHKTNNAIATSDVEVRLPQRYVINQPRYWAIFSIDISGRLSVVNRVFYDEREATSICMAS